MGNNLNTLTEGEEVTAQEMLSAAFIGYYDVLYADTYDGYDSFMWDMFGCKRNISCDIMRDFCDSSLIEFSGVRFDHYSVCRKFDGDLVIRLYSINRGAIIIEWFQKFGPVHAYWQ